VAVTVAEFLTEFKEFRNGIYGMENKQAKSKVEWSIYGVVAAVIIIMFVLVLLSAS
jgi:hypothetical protein